MVTTARILHRNPRIAWKGIRRIVKRAVPLGLALAFIPKIFAFYLVCGLLDVRRNKKLDLDLLKRYFVGNGLCTWLLSPFNLLMDLLALPLVNRGVYQLEDLPASYQEEINELIDLASHSDLIEQLENAVGEQERIMVFFKWYGMNVETRFNVPAFHQEFKYIRTIGVSVFNRRQSTSKHYGPLRVTLRLLYNLNTITDRNAYIQVDDRQHHWCDNKLYIFDDTLQHESHNQTDVVRYCLFVDILRPSMIAPVMQIILSGLRVILLRFNFMFYRNWKFVK